MASANASSSAHMPPVTPAPAVFRLLDLPPELRLIVFEALAQDTTFRISVTGRLRAEDWPAVCLVSHQFYEDVLPIMYRYAAIEAPVRDMDFDRVITFTRRLSDVCYKALFYNERLTLYIDRFTSFSLAYEDLRRWLRCRQRESIPWKYAVVVANSMKTDFPSEHTWDYGGEWYLVHCGFLDLSALAEISSCDHDKWTLDQILRAWWRWAHPEVTLSSAKPKSSSA
ncbi:hypothetical protein LTR36_001596 [Oleoguttula mirabilis]|uniref:F-box domain-containing protein n=1 Tax=Oleoguttula mirabilis TaxID=1507867 RepID=A0AAV9JNA7_9PEZI|nr:hypothetical protein LTR36_001596 [Oleoguttula mirabilis]